MSFRHDRCPACGQLSVNLTPDTSAFSCRNDTCAADAQRRLAQQPQGLTAAQITEQQYQRLGAAILQNPRTSGWVYYLRFGDRVKIGTTTNPSQRFKAIAHDEVLAIEPGSSIVERERHEQFVSLRVPSQREWFHWSPELAAHCVELSALHGRPDAIIREAA